MRPLGPWPLRGTWPAKNGVLQYQWQCKLCGIVASNSTALKKVIFGFCNRKTEIRQVVHQLEGEGEWQCLRCGLTGDAGHRDAASRRHCQVPQVVCEDQVWDEPEDWRQMRLALGLAAVFRDWCTSAEQDQARQEEESAMEPQEIRNGAQALQAYREHRPLGQGSTPVCIECGQQARRKEQVKFWKSQPCPGQVEVSSISMARRFRIGTAWRMQGLQEVPVAWRTRAATIAESVEELLRGIGDG